MAYVRGDAAAAAANLNEVALWMGDSLSHINTAARVLSGLTKRSELQFGLLGCMPTIGASDTQTGQSHSSVPNNVTAVSPGQNYPSGYPQANRNNFTSTNMIVYAGDQAFGGANQNSSFRPASFANDWMTGNLRVSELRTQFDNGLTAAQMRVTNRDGTQVIQTPTNHRTGVDGSIAFQETAAFAAGTGANSIVAQIQYWNSPSPTDETGLASNLLLRVLRRDGDLSGRFGFLFAGHPGQKVSGHAYSDGGVGVGDPDLDPLCYSDAALVALYQNYPIKKIVLMAGQNGTPTVTQLNAWDARQIAAITAAGKNPADFKRELISTHDATQGALNVYNPATEQVKYNNIRAVYDAFVAAKGANYYHVPMGLEWREKYGNLPAWGDTYLSGFFDGTNYDYIHFKDEAATIQWAADYIALMLRGPAPSSTARSRRAMSMGIGLSIYGAAGSGGFSG